MIASRSRSRGTLALAALLLAAALAPASPLHAQQKAPTVIWGRAASPDTEVVVLVDGVECETAVVGADGDGYVWTVTIMPGECGAATGSQIRFTVDGRPAAETLTWGSGLATPIALTVTEPTAEPATAAPEPPAPATAPAPGDAPGPIEVVVELRVWQRVTDDGDIWVSARAQGGDWRTLGTIPFPLEQGGYPDGRYRSGDLAVAGAGLRLWRVRGEPALVFVCAGACEAPRRMHTLPLGMAPLTLDDGHSPGGWYRYGDLTIATSPDHPELEQDRVRMLRIAETLGGSPGLNWRIENPLAEWEGVAVAGTPPRVTAIALAGRGLTGTISGLLGELTALEELRLLDNSLTGAIPSKLGRLESLTYLSLGGNSLTGCVPPPLRSAAPNDLDALGLHDCLPPIEVSSRRQRLEGGAYLIQLPGEAPLIFDVPDGLPLAPGGTTRVPSLAGLSPMLLLWHEDGDLAVVFDPKTGGEGPAIRDDWEGPDPILRWVIESAWLGAPGAPRLVPPALTVLASGSAGQVVLEWTPAPAGAVVWEYRVRKPEQAWWGEWTAVGGSDANTRRHRLTGLERGAAHHFEVRPRPGYAGLTYPAAEATPLEEGQDGIARAMLGQALEQGRLFRAGETPYTFRVPRGLPLALDAVWETPSGSTRIRWVETTSGSSLTYDTDWRSLVRLHIVHDGAPRGITALFDQLMESIGHQAE